MLILAFEVIVQPLLHTLFNELFFRFLQYYAWPLLSLTAMQKVSKWQQKVSSSGRFLYEKMRGLILKAIFPEI